MAKWLNEEAKVFPAPTDLPAYKPESVKEQSHADTALVVGFGWMIGLVGVMFPVWHWLS